MHACTVDNASFCVGAAPTAEGAGRGRSCCCAPGGNVRVGNGGGVLGPPVSLRGFSESFVKAGGWSPSLGVLVAG